MIKKISNYDWPDTIQESDGYESNPTPDLTRDNLEFLAEKFNELIQELDDKGLL